MKIVCLFLCAIGLAVSGLCSSAVAQELKVIKLPPPQTNGGRPLMQVLSERKSTRDFAPGSLSLQTLSNLLWAAFGINRRDGRRTAPSAVNWQEVSIYVATPEGVYLYDAHANALDPALAGDFRAGHGHAIVRESRVSEPGLCFGFVQNRRLSGRRNVYRRGCRLHCAECVLVLRFGGIGRCGARQRG